MIVVKNILSFIEDIRLE